MRELEICKPAYNKRDNVNVWRLFIKSNHRCNNRRATFEELRNALRSWENTETEKPNCPIYFIPFGDSLKEKEYLHQCLTKNESIDNKNIVCLMGQDWCNEYETTGVCIWYKIVLYDSVEKHYYLRNFTTKEKRSADDKVLTPSHKEGWYVDLSTLCAPAEFWLTLRDILKISSVGSIEKRNSVLDEFDIESVCVSSKVMDTCYARKCFQNSGLTQYHIRGSKWNDFKRCDRKVIKDGFCRKCYQYDQRSDSDPNKINDQLWKRDGIYGQSYDFPFHVKEHERQWVQMIYDLHPTIKPTETSKKKKEKQFWKDLKDIHDRKEFIEVLRKELSDEEIYFLCEKI